MDELELLRALLAQLRAGRLKILQTIVAIERGAASEADPQVAEELRQRMVGLRAEAASLREREINGPALELQPMQLINSLEGDMPILLAPLRVQTRFADGPEGRVLLVRVYPDDFSVQTLDPQLSAAELTAGNAYWQAPTDKPDERTLSRLEIWRGLVASHGAPRATYLRQATDPAGGMPQTGPRHAALWTMPERLVFRCLGHDDLLLGEFIGRPIPDGLEAGFDPTQQGAGFRRPEGAAGDLDVPPELAWQYDFDAAVKVGMAIRIPLSQLGNPRRIERIVVLGVRLASDAAASADLLARLLDDHRFTEGFELVPQGTPTNVTQEGEARSTLDADALDTLLGTRGAFEPPAGRTLYQDEPDGLRLARALGLDPEQFRHVPNAGGRDGAEAIAMKRALWAGTLGYYAQQMLAPLFENGDPLAGDLGERTILTSRFFFTNFVFGRGPLPAVRVGPQPYGILPVSADMLDPVTPGVPAWGDDFVDTFMDKLHGKLQILARTWKDLAKTAPRVASGQLAEVLSLQASSVEFRASRLMGSEYLQNYVDFKDEDTGVIEMGKFTTLLTNRHARFEHDFPGLLPPAVFAKSPAIFHMTFFGGLWRRILAELEPAFERSLSPPLPGDIIDDLPLSENRGLAETYPNYIRALATLDLAEARRGLQRTGADGKPVPVTALLYQMLRHSYLYEYVFAAMRMVHHATGVPWRTFHEKELLNIGWDLDRTYWDVLELPVTIQVQLPFINHIEVTPLDLLRQRDSLGALLPRSREQLGDVNELHHALAHLVDVPTARLERLFAEHVDLCGYRLDAWLTGWVYQRLLGRRLVRDAQQPHPLREDPQEGRQLRYDLNLRPLDGASRGLYLGAYGIVEGLEADPPGVPVADLAEALKPRNGAPVTRDPDNIGLIHAPSLNHAVTAAILRSGSVSEPGTEAFNIELSSARTRDALWMIEGIRNGQLPAALLGYRFERGLRDAVPPLQQHLPALRGAFPMPRPPETQPDDARESIPAHDVVNGLALVEALREHRLDAALAALNPSLDGGALTAVRGLAAALAELLDACADLMLAESVHQAALGNHARAGAAVTSAGEFTHVPDRFDVVETPRSGNLISHRLLLAFDPAANVAGADTPRARLAPPLNAWVAGLLGPLEQIACRIDYLDDADSPASHASVLQSPIRPPLASFPITLDQLALAPLDIVFLLDDAQGTELARRADVLARPLFEADLPDAPAPRIELQLFGAVAPGQRAVGELMPLAAQLRRLLAHARSATRRDLLAPKMLHDAAGSQASLESIDGLALQLAVLGTMDGQPDVNPDSLLLSAQATADALAGAEIADEAELGALLLDAAAFGLPDAVPVPVGAPGASRLAALRDQAQRTQAALLARIKAAQDQTQPKALTADLLSACTEAAKTLLGTSLPLLPAIVMAEDLSAAALLPGAPADERIEDWLFAASLVRPGAERLQHARTLAAAADAPFEPMRVLQWPASAKGWIADPRPAGEDWSDDRVAIVVQSASPLDLAQPLVGLVVDEWSELLPSDTETTGIAFHYDAPNSEPPQALLLAVPTRAWNSNGRWSWDELVHCVEGAFNLARLRVVGPDELRHTALDAVLPAAVMAESAVPVTVSTSLFSRASTEIAASQAHLWSKT